MQVESIRRARDQDRSLSSKYGEAKKGCSRDVSIGHIALVPMATVELQADKAERSGGIPVPATRHITGDDGEQARSLVVRSSLKGVVDRAELRDFAGLVWDRYCPIVFRRA